MKKTPENQDIGDRFLRLPQVVAKVGLTRASIYRIMNEGGFPKCRKLGVQAVAWKLSEIDAWMDERPVPDAA